MKNLNLITIILAVFIVLMGCKKETPKETPTCSFVYSAWTSCSNSIQTRTYTSSPSGCTGNPPADSLQRSCVMGKIGDQIWTLTNLDVATYRNGDPIPQVQDNTAWSVIFSGGVYSPRTTGAWCYYENKTANGTTYGKLYNWYAVNDPRGLAPTGYHIPTDAEWTTLTTYLGGEAGTKMKSTSGWLNNGNGTNTSGFAGLPGGYITSSGSSENIGIESYWWSSSESLNYFAWHRSLYWNYYVNSSYSDKSCGFYVRCIKD